MENRKWEVGHRGRVVACRGAFIERSANRRGRSSTVLVAKNRWNIQKIPKSLDIRTPPFTFIFDFFYSTDHCTTTTTIHHIIQIIIQYQAKQHKHCNNIQWTPQATLLAMSMASMRLPDHEEHLLLKKRQRNQIPTAWTIRSNLAWVAIWCGRTFK